jgi:hypothetical protein
LKLKEESFNAVALRVHSKNIRVLLDSGATRNCISYSFFKHLHVPDTWLKTNVVLPLVTADGSPLHSLGQISLDVSLQGLSVRTQFYVIRNLSVKCILGVNFLQDNHAIFDYANRTLSSHNGLAVAPLISRFGRDSILSLDKRRTVIHFAQELSLKRSILQRNVQTSRDIKTDLRHNLVLSSPVFNVGDLVYLKNLAQNNAPVPTTRSNNDVPLRPQCRPQTDDPTATVNPRTTGQSLIDAVYRPLPMSARTQRTTMIDQSTATSREPATTRSHSSASFTYNDLMTPQNAESVYRTIQSPESITAVDLTVRDTEEKPLDLRISSILTMCEKTDDDKETPLDLRLPSIFNMREKADEDINRNNVQTEPLDLSQSACLNRQRSQGGQFFPTNL